MFTLIVVDYNSLDTTIEYVHMCRNSLGLQGAGHVVIVENGTQDGTFEKLEAAFSQPEILEISTVEQPVYLYKTEDQQIIYCHSGDNLGYAKGNNLGAIIADSIWNDPYYIISNNDLVFRWEFDLSVVDKLMKQNPKIGVIGPKVITPAGEAQSPRLFQSAFKRLIFQYWVSAFGGLFGRNYQKKIYSCLAQDTVIGAESGPCSWVSGCFMIVRSEAFHQIGMFDTHTFLYAEEMILSKRMESKGYGVYYCDELQLIHNHAQTTQKSLNALRMTQIDFEANYYFYKTYMHTSPVILALAKASFGIFCALFKLKQRIK